MPKKLVVTTIGIALAAVLFAPGASAHAATLPAVHAAASAASPGSVALARAGGASAKAVDPECKLFFMDQKGKPGGLAHISSFLFHNHNIRAVKINAQISCRRVSMHLFLQVTLWKTGAIFPHKVAGPNPPATAAKGNQLKNQHTWKECKNNTKTTYYGTAFGRVVFRGVTYSTSLQSGKATLPCGT
jgi:hypothetical protein